MRSRAKWTVMIYMAGDNNLESAAMVDLKEMAKVGSTSAVNIVVQLDRERDSITKRIRVLKKGHTSPTLLLPETDTGDPAVLADFLQWSVANYPADRYMLVLWNHGGGWWEDERSGRKKRLSFFKHAHPAIGKRGICYDDTSNGDCLDNAELKKTLADFSTLIGGKLDILGMDACLMQMIEVAYQLKDSVFFIVGSELEEPENGWPYHTILSYLVKNPNAAPDIFSKEIVTRYVQSYSAGKETVTQSAFNADNIIQVKSAIDNLAVYLTANLDDDAFRNGIADAWRKSVKFFDDNYVDLKSFANVLKTKCPKSTDLNARVNALLNSLKVGKEKGAVIAAGYQGSSMKSTGGMSICFPADHINSAYKYLDFNSAEGSWLEFLKKFLS